MFNHLPQQPDLNWWNDGVRAEFDDILRFWFDRGVAGFRIDVCNLIVKDAELRDNPAATDDDDPGTRVLGHASSSTAIAPKCTTSSGIGGRSPIPTKRRLADRRDAGGEERRAGALLRRRR